jgi:hypothetical protein
MQIRSGFFPFDKNYYDSSFKHTYIGQHRTESFEVKLLSLGVLLTHKKNNILYVRPSLYGLRTMRDLLVQQHMNIDRARRCES